MKATKKLCFLAALACATVLCSSVLTVNGNAVTENAAASDAQIESAADLALELNAPPMLTVKCGTQEVTVGCFNAYWDGPEMAFNACGDAPSSPDVRDLLPVVNAQPGDTLTFTYPQPASHLTVSLWHDELAEEATEILCDDDGVQELVLVLPENCAGVYEVSDQWNTDLGSGGGNRGFLLVVEESAI